MKISALIIFGFGKSGGDIKSENLKNANLNPMIKETSEVAILEFAIFGISLTDIVHSF